MTEVPRTDVVVVGAGVSGLTAARRIEQAGRSVTVLEAADRVGGRTLLAPIGGATFDMGGQWVGPGQDRIAAVIDELGLDTFPTPSGGKTVLDIDNDRRVFEGTIPKLSLPSLFQLQRLIRRIEKDADRVDGRRRELFDDITLQDWLFERGLHHDVRMLVTAAMRVVFGAEPEDLSYLQFAEYVRAAGGIEPLIEVAGGAQERRVVGGVGQVCERLADELDGDVHLGHPVDRISETLEYVEVAADRRRFRADQVIVAIPPKLVLDIQVEPALHARHRRWLDESPMGQTIKCIAVYERRFWKDAGLSGEAISSGGPLSLVFDNTTETGVPALLGFCVASPGRAWGSRPLEERKDAVLAQLADLFGDAAAHPVAYHDHDWSEEPWIGGCPVALPTVRTATGTDVDPTAPRGRLHFAGTELASRWRGFLDGAVRSGERAASEALAAL